MCSIELNMYGSTVQMTNVGRQGPKVAHIAVCLESKVFYVEVLDIGEFIYHKMKFLKVQWNRPGKKLVVER